MAKRTICGDTPIADLARDTIRRQRKKLRKNERGLHGGQADEAVHEMRIAIRKLRTSLQVFEELSVFDQRKVHRLRTSLRQPGRMLGAVRDLDVLLARVDGDEAVNAHGDAVMLHAALVRRRSKAWKRLMRELQGKGMREAVAELKRFPKGYWARMNNGSRGPRRLRAHDAIGSVIWRRYEEVRAFEEVMPAAASHAQLHEVRIACKHLRYVLEMFDQSEEPQWQPLVATLKEAQSSFGALQDNINALATLSSVLDERPENTATATAVQSTERGIEDADFAGLWSRLTGLDFRQRLGGFIAAL
ncbi:MAG: CHAD domain-containing protein [Burkholderiales bacterium]